MSEFLLLAVRPPGRGRAEVSPAGVARDLAAAAAWQAWLRRWGLLRSFGLPDGPADGPAGGVRACLIVRASGPAAAGRLAAGWAGVSGCPVTVTELCAVTAVGQGGGG
jgi:hypothetical protein